MMTADTRCKLVSMEWTRGVGEMSAGLGPGNPEAVLGQFPRRVKIVNSQARNIGEHLLKDLHGRAHLPQVSSQFATCFRMNESCETM